VHAVGDVSNGDFVLGPPLEQRGEYLPANLPMQLADPISGPAASKGEERHVKRLVSIGGIMATKRHQLLEVDAKFLRGVARQVLLHQHGSEEVESGRDRGVSSK